MQDATLENSTDKQASKQANESQAQRKYDIVVESLGDKARELKKAAEDFGRIISKDSEINVK